ncbi:MAG: DUF1259 domain-containing protein [Candidatus Hydrogenedentes bacterium]|nr:DUF1259 domain-containing protein [Candidatus Hydrogenedentota bacterium]
MHPRIAFRLTLLATFPALFTLAAPAALDMPAIGETVGVKPTLTPDGVVKIAYPRKEIEVKIDGVPLRPFAGLTSWAAFKETPEGAMAMGDTVLFEDEITPAIDAAFSAGLEITALHNHFLYDQPKVYFMHIGGIGPAIELARGVRQVWNAVRAVRVTSPTLSTDFGGAAPREGTVNPAPLEEALGLKGAVEDGMVKFTIGRDAEMHGIPIGGSMGLTTWAAFTGTDEAAAMDGDVIMTGPEVQPVLRALRRSSIYIVALHNHMIDEEPAFYFVHFWGKGPAKELATGLKSVLDVQKAVGKPEMKDHNK